MSSPASQPSPASALEPSPLPSAAVGGLPSSAGPASLLGLGIAVESVSSVDVPPVAAELASGGATGGGGGSSDPTARPLPSPDPTTNGSGSLAAQRPPLAARSTSTTPLSPPSGYSDRHEPLLDATGVRVEAGSWRVSVAADDGAGSRGRTRGKLCVYIQSATHNYTLLRTVKEIKETHDKLVAGRVINSLPAFPAAALAFLHGPASGNGAVPSSGQFEALSSEPPARKSSIRRVFSRLREGSRDRSAAAASASADETASGLSTPKPSTARALLSPPRSPLLDANRALNGNGSTPTIEEEDPLDALRGIRRSHELPPIPSVSPFLLAAEDGMLGRLDTSQSVVSASSSTPEPAGVVVAGVVLDSEERLSESSEPSPLARLSTFLTTLANNRTVRDSKPWRRFLRVRSEDLASTRVERKIVRTQSGQGLHQAAGLPSSIRGFGRTLRPFRPIDDSSISNLSPGDFPGDGVVVDVPQEGADLPQESGADISAKGLADSAFVHALRSHPEGGSSANPSGAMMPLEAPIELSPGGRNPLAAASQQTPSATLAGYNRLGLAAPSESSLSPNFDGAAHSPPFPEDADRSPSMLESSPRPPSTGPVKASPELTDGREARGQFVNPVGPHVPPAVAASIEDQPVSASMQRRARNGARRKVGINDFELIRVLGKGCAGKVLLVRKKERNGNAGGPLLALKSIVKRHVLAHQELQHTLTEQAVLRRMSRDIKNPFVVHLHYSFHDSENLFLIMDFHPGGDLATQLARWGKFGRDRARFYAAEIVEGVQGLHAAGVIYRDLKPENILLDGDGHLVLTDFGLSKEFPRRALSSPPVALADGDVDGFDLDPEPPVVPQYMQALEGDVSDQQRLDWAPTGSLLTDQTGTFCGTAEYLAPEVIRGLPYSYGVDWWSFGTLLFEMLVGVTPFWAPNHNEMYARVLHDELVFPEERAIDKDTRSLLRGLLQADPALRLGEPRIKKHSYFQMISWEHVYHKRYIPPYTPPTDPENALDTQNFDDAFLDMAPTIDGDAGDEGLAAAPSAANAAAAAEMADRASLWGGYSYRERDAASIFTVGSEQDGSYGRKSSELLRGSMDSSRLGVGPEGYASLEGTLAAPAVPSDHPQQPSNDDSLDTVDRPAPEASTTSYSSLDESLQEPPISPVSVHANIGRTGIAAVDRDRLNSSDSEPDAGPVEADSDDDDDDGWDVIEKPRAGLQAENGLRAPTLFARGVIDRYRFGDLRRRESKAVLGRQTSPFEQPAVPPISVQTATPPTSFSSRRGLTFKGGRFRRKVNSDLQNLGELKTAPASLKGSTSTPSSLGQAPLMPPMSPPIPSGFSTPRGTASPSTPRPELSSRSSSVSPTKTSGRSSSGMASEDDGPIAGTGSRLSSGEKLKLFGRSGQEKVLSLFKTGS